MHYIREPRIAAESIRGCVVVVAGKPLSKRPPQLAQLAAMAFICSLVNASRIYADNFNVAHCANAIYDSYQTLVKTLGHFGCTRDMVHFWSICQEHMY